MSVCVINKINLGLKVLGDISTFRVQVFKNILISGGFV